MSGEEEEPYESEEEVGEREAPAPSTFDVAKLQFLSEAGEKIKELLDMVKRFKASIDWGLATSNITRSEKHDILDILRCGKAYEDLGMLKEAAEEYSDAYAILQSSKSVDATLLKTTVTQRQEIYTGRPKKRYSRIAQLLGIAPKEEGE
jgi:hypothetical protein